jgi:hypothetical protein
LYLNVWRHDRNAVVVDRKSVVILDVAKRLPHAGVNRIVIAQECANVLLEHRRPDSALSIRQHVVYKIAPALSQVGRL